MSDIKLNYLTPARFTSGRIIEYDIQAANANILYSKKYIDEDEYKKITSMAKMNREIYIGNMIKKRPEVYTVIRSGITEYVKRLLVENNVQEDEVVRIANDAVYINRMTDLPNTEFDHVRFVQKSKANNMVNINNVLIFSNYDNNQIDVETKNLGELSSELHQKYLLGFIANTIYLFERVSVEEAIQSVSNFYNDYVNRRLPVEYYMTFNSTPNYEIMANNFKITSAPSINDININYNLNVLRELYSILMDYFH